MEKVLEYFLFAVLCIMYVTCEEMTIPVGVEGRDTVTVIRTQDAFGNYDVGYNENQLTGGASFHRERGYANGTRQGSYGYTTRNGLIRIVTYVADRDGYRSELLTNEPGVSAVSPSNVTVSKEQEPDPEALARGPTAAQSQESVEVSGSDVIRNYVLGPASGVVDSIGSRTGSARVMISSPHGRYQYDV